MKYLFLTLLLIGCASSPPTYKTGDCVKLSNTLKFGEVVAQTPEGQDIFKMYLVDTAQEKVKCPSDKTNERQFIGRDR